MHKFLVPYLFCLPLFTSVAFGQVKQTDREFEGLKGKVKSVLTERADAKTKSGKVVETKRRKVSDLLYDSDGGTSVLKNYDWNSGELSDTDTYLQIDGDKAFKTEMGPAAITGTFAEQPPDAKASKPWDPRYDYRFKYKYDNRGRIVESTMWQGDGDLWLRYRYEYAEGERRELVYDAEGALNQKYIYKLDAKGNEIELITYDAATGKIEGKEKYEYLGFDAQGNWTKRIEYEADSDSGFKFKLREVKYRRLIYY